MTIRAVIDTNIWISSINWQGAAYQIRQQAQNKGFVSVISLPILAEVTRVMRQYFGFSDAHAYAWYCQIGAISEIVNPVSTGQFVLDDPDDQKFLDCAITGQVDYIVSQDNDLLRVGQYQAVQILSAQAFLEILSEQPNA